MDQDEVRTPGGFPATRLSVIERMRDADPEARREAFGDLVEGYWKPVYKHLRITWRLDSEEARDFTQAFFADAFQKSWLERYEPGKARFRTFVRVCADRFVMNMRQSASRVKRGGGVQTVSLDVFDFGGVEREVAAAQRATQREPDDLFHHEFVRALFERTVQELRAELEAGGRQTHFALFEQYDLAPAEGISYAQLANDFGLTTSQVTNNLAHVRRRFRERALATLRGLCGSDQEFRREARDLFGVEVE
jgi:DNA-directed RNA polymerase specialized sigma24 family protein